MARKGVCSANDNHYWPQLPRTASRTAYQDGSSTETQGGGASEAGLVNVRPIFSVGSSPNEARERQASVYIHTYIPYTLHPAPGTSCSNHSCTGHCSSLNVPVRYRRLNAVTALGSCVSPRFTIHIIRKNPGRQDRGHYNVGTVRAVNLHPHWVDHLHPLQPDRLHLHTGLITYTQCSICKLCSTRANKDHNNSIQINWS